MLRKILAATLIVASVCIIGATETEKKTPPPGFGLQPAGQPPDGIFQPVAIDPALAQKSMQARREYDQINREINAYKTKLYEENTEIKALQTKMRELQDKIDGILDADEDLQKLKAQQQAISPEFPVGARPFPLAPQPVPAGQPGPDGVSQPKQP